MKLFLNGSTQNENVVELFRVSDKTLQAALVEDDGTPIAQTGETWSLELYDDSKRTNTEIDSIAFTAVTAAAGQGAFVVTDGDSTYTQNVLYAFAKRITSGGLISFSSNYAKVMMR
jgi:hypothetical protein